MIVIDTSPNEAPITELFAFLSVDDKGNEGIVAIPLFRNDVTTPCIVSKRRIAEQLRPRVQNFADTVGVKVRLVRFTRDDHNIERLQPSAPRADIVE